MKKLILLIIFILCLNTVLGIQFNSTNVVGKTDVKVKGQVLIKYDNTTPHRFPIYNVTVTDLAGFNFSKIQQLDYNKSAYLNFSYMTNTPKTQVFTGKIWYFYYTNGTTERNEINNGVNGQGFTLSNISFFQNDTIRWTNLGSGEHTITNLNNPNDRLVLQVGQSVSRTFPDVGTFQYFDETTLKAGFVTIKSNKILKKTHTPNFDKDINFNVSVTYRDAKFSVLFLPTSFSSKANQVKTGIMQITSNDTLHHVKFTADWFKFPQNDFSMSGEKVLQFNLSINGLTETTQTNKSYQKKIRIDTDNGGFIEKNLTVFVEYTQLDELKALLGDVVLIPMTPEQTFAYCNKKEVNWTGICKRWIKNESVIQYVPRVLYSEINETDVKENQEAGRRAEESTNRVSNKVEELNSVINQQAEIIQSLNTRIEQFDSKYSGTIDKIGAEVQTKSENSGTVTGIIVFLFIMGLIGGGIFIFIRWRKNLTPKHQLRM